MQNTQGFSLIELIIIIVIIGVLAVLPFYNWPGTGISIDAQAMQFADDVRYTQSLSMSKTERFTIIGLSTTTYQIQNSAGTPILLASGSTTRTFNSGLTFGTETNLPNSSITFDGRGTPYLSTGTAGTPLASGTTYSLTITGGGNTKTITITPITGRVLVS